MNKILRVAAKEFASFFSSPVAYIFMGVFLAASLFIFFWVETFFAVNITEVRALFDWMPILLIFLTSAITMRLWAEEKRAGTLEFLLTAPVSPTVLVLGKFVGCLGLIIVSLVLTLPLALTVSLMGDLDWGPVWGGYIAAIFLGAAYIAIGLFVSVKSENQIISLIVSVLVCALFFLLGSNILSDLVGTKGAEILALLGSGSRFDAITRGVIDLRDLYYYLTIAGVFLCFNVYGLEKERWAGNPGNNKHRLWQYATLLIAGNLVAGNFWLAPLGNLRMDMTEGNIYSISDTTRNYLKQLKEPLLIRGYFSEQTHPLLAPLVPRLKDLLEEYAVAGGAAVNVEFIDPLEHPELEQEAGQKYGIRPVPFQTASKYQSAVTNSYFDLLISYGDQYETLGFNDLIEIKRGGTDVIVELQNPEYDITRAIRKTLYAYQSGGDVFAGIEGDVVFHGYFSADAKLPETLVALRGDLQNILEELQKSTAGRFKVSIEDPESDGGALAVKLSEEYGFQPMSASLFSNDTFWFYIVLENGDRYMEVSLPEELDKEGMSRTLQNALKRLASGVTKNIAYHTQPVTAPIPQYNIPAHGKSFEILKEMLSREHGVIDSDLKDGIVPDQSDILLLASPEKLDEKQLFAVDQFLMQGGTVILATSAFDIEMHQQLAVVGHNSGLEDWLSFNGIDIGEKLVMDTRNSPFPVPVDRNIGGFIVKETKLIDYPPFVDIRRDGMLGNDLFFSAVSQLVMNWSSPITVDAEKNVDRKVTELLKSSENSWLTTDLVLQPDFRKYPEYGFAEGEEKAQQLLGVMVEGSFTSYFKEKESPLAKGDDKKAAAAATGQDGEKAVEKQVIRKIVESSPATSRIICLASNSFLADAILQLGSGVRGSGYLDPLQLISNIVDFSLEDAGLLEIRGRGHFARPLMPMKRNDQLFFEYLNYALAVLGLVVVWFIANVRRKKARRREQNILQGIAGRA